MPYPISKKIKVDKIFRNQEIELNFHSGLTTLVGPNACGKTQTLRVLQEGLSNIVSASKIRYLSSNRIGILEQFRSTIDQTNYKLYSPESIRLGSLDAKKARHQIEVATGDFFTMDEQKEIFIKVSERLSTLFSRDIFLRWEGGYLKVYFGKRGFNEEYSIAAEASGLINVISILAALYDDEIKILLIDEPEVSLHPQLQSFLLKEIRCAAGDYVDPCKKMIIMATHSTEMIQINSAEDLCNYIFFAENGIIPSQISPQAEVLKNNKLKDLIGRLGQIHKTSFFSCRPLLVEGTSDSLICKYFDNKFDFNLGISGTQIIPVDGKGQFPVTTKLMRLIGKRPIILTDLDSFVDSNDVINLFAEVNDCILLAQSHGHADISSFIRTVKNDIQTMCSRHKDDFLEKYKSNPYWLNKEDIDEELAAKRAIISSLFNASKDDIRTWSNSAEWQGLKTRIEVLLDCLERAGCFVLRKGALESYYLYSPKDTYNDKPNFAIEEINYLESADINIVKTSYDDIIRALKYCSNADIIDEARAVKNELLCELGPIMGMLSIDTKIEDVIRTIKHLRGTNKSIFDYKVINNQEKPEIEVNLKSNLISVIGFPLYIKKGDNINQVVEDNIKIKS